MINALVFEPFREITGGVRRAIVAEQPGFVGDLGLVAPDTFNAS